MQRTHLRRKWYRIELTATRLIDRLGLPENQKLFFITLIVGAVCGLVAVSFHIIILAMERNIIRHMFVAAERGFNWRFAVLALVIPTLGGLAGRIAAAILGSRCTRQRNPPGQDSLFHQLRSNAFEISFW